MRLFAASGAPGTLVCLARMLLDGAFSDVEWRLGCPPALRGWLSRALGAEAGPNGLSSEGHLPEGWLVDLPDVDASHRDATLGRLLEGVDTVLVGTDLGLCIDERLATVARGAGLPVHYYIDFATCIPERVVQMHPGPGTVLAPGVKVAEDLVRAGCPMPVTDCGHPEFERLLAVDAAASRVAAERVRRAAGLPDDALLVAYFSQPFSDHRAVYHDAHLDFLDSGRLGYDELSIFDAVAAALSRRSRPAALFVQPHPRETPGKYASRMEARAAGVLHRAMWGGTKDELLLAADVVLGLQSTVLVEAVYLGRPVASLDIGAAYGGAGKEASPFDAASWGVACIGDMATLQAGLDDVRRLLPASRNPLGIRPGCAARLAQVLCGGATTPRGVAAAKGAA